MDFIDFFYFYILLTVISYLSFIKFIFLDLVQYNLRMNTYSPKYKQCFIPLSKAFIILLLLQIFIYFIKILIKRACREETHEFFFNRKLYQKEEEKKQPTSVKIYLLRDFNFFLYVLIDESIRNILFYISSFCYLTVYNQFIRTQSLIILPFLFFQSIDLVKSEATIRVFESSIAILFKPATSRFNFSFFTICYVICIFLIAREVIRIFSFFFTQDLSSYDTRNLIYELFFSNYRISIIQTLVMNLISLFFLLLNVYHRSGGLALPIQSMVLLLAMISSSLLFECVHIFFMSRVLYDEKRIFSLLLKSIEFNNKSTLENVDIKSAVEDSKQGNFFVLWARLLLSLMNFIPRPFMDLMFIFSSFIAVIKLIIFVIILSFIIHHSVICSLVSVSLCFYYNKFYITYYDVSRESYYFMYGFNVTDRDIRNRNENFIFPFFAPLSTFASLLLCFSFIFIPTNFGIIRCFGKRIFIDKYIFPLQLLSFFLLIFNFLYSSFISKDGYLFSFIIKISQTAFVSFVKRFCVIFTYITIFVSLFNISFFSLAKIFYKFYYKINGIPFPLTQENIIMLNLPAIALFIFIFIFNFFFTSNFSSLGDKLSQVSFVNNTFLFFYLFSDSKLEEIFIKILCFRPKSFFPSIDEFKRVFFYIFNQLFVFYSKFLLLTFIYSLFSCQADPISVYTFLTFKESLYKDIYEINKRIIYIYLLKVFCYFIEEMALYCFYVLAVNLKVKQYADISYIQLRKITIEKLNSFFSYHFFDVKNYEKLVLLLFRTFYLMIFTIFSIFFTTSRLFPFYFILFLPIDMISIHFTNVISILFLYLI